MVTYLDLSLAQWNDIKLRLVAVDQNTYALAIADMAGAIIGGGALDAFGRQRVSTPFTLFDNVNQYDESPLFWETKLVGAGAITHLPNESSVQLDVGTASGDSVIRQTKGYIRYQPGKSQLVMMTGLLGSGQEKQVKNIGYYDEQNGTFFQLTDAGVGVVIRSYISGSVVDTRVEQANWNIDPFDGTGISGHTLDISKVQIFTVDLEWLGVGSVRFGFVVDGILHYVHQFNHSNIIDSVYMTTANLPLRYEITNSDTAVASSMKQICAQVSSEGGRQDTEITFSAVNEALRAVSDIEIPIIAIRPALTHPASGSVENRGVHIPIKWTIYSEDAAIIYKVVHDCVVVSGAWNDVDADNSGMQVNLTGTSIVGGVVIDSGLLAAKAGTTPQRIPGGAEGETESDLFLSLNIDGDTAVEYAIVLQKLGATESDCAASITWRELF